MKKSNRNLRTKLRRQTRHKQTVQNIIDEKLYIESRLDIQTLEGQIKLPIQQNMLVNKDINIYQKFKNFLYSKLYLFKDLYIIKCSNR
jgi:hypothetical protein